MQCLWEDAFLSLQPKSGSLKSTCKCKGACNKKRMTSYSHSFMCLGKNLPICPCAYPSSGKRMERADFPLHEAKNCLESWLQGQGEDIHMNCPYLSTHHFLKEAFCGSPQCRLASLDTCSSGTIFLWSIYLFMIICMFLLLDCQFHKGSCRFVSVFVF